MIKVAISGASCSGKTGFIEYLKHKHGSFLYMPEIASVVKSMNVAYLEKNERTLFQDVVFELQKSAERILEVQLRDSRGVLICDRGSIDALAYYAEQEFILMEGDSIVSDIKYDGVIFFEMPSIDVYYEHREHNMYRDEDYETSQKLENRLKALWGINHKLNVVPYMTSVSNKYAEAERATIEIILEGERQL